jgi:hypothetical protein
VGTWLAMLSFATLNGSGPATLKLPGDFKPVVSQSLINGVSAPLRDLPAAQPVQREIENELLRFRPNQPVPPNFVDPAVQTVAAPVAAPTPITNFEGQSANDSGCGCIPPDPNGAVGPTQYVQMVNSVFSVYSKTGTRLTGPRQINTLFSGLPGTACANNNNGDPVVVYDRIADRWMLSQFAVPGGSVG